jgi:hypothetical protein
MDAIVAGPSPPSRLGEDATLGAGTTLAGGRPTSPLSRVGVTSTV